MLLLFPWWKALDDLLYLYYDHALNLDKIIWIIPNETKL